MSSTTAHNVQKTTKKNKRSSGISTASVSKPWDVTNNSGADLVVIDAFPGDPASTDELYGRFLQPLSSSDGQQFIKAGETKTISVGEAHTDAEGNPVDFEIILARADNLFPVKIVELVNDGAESFPATTVTTADAAVMTKAQTFVQTITAFPSSDMAMAFAAVLADPDEQKIAGFFGSYPDYATVTLDAVTAVQTHYSRYAFVWAGYNANKTYNLYTSDGTTKKNLGALSISNQTVAPLTAIDAPAGLTATYADTARQKTTLNYSAGQFSEDVNSDNPKICLQGLFLLKSGLTGDAADNILMPVVVGVVNGSKVFGYADDPVLSRAADLTPNTTDMASVKSAISDWLNPQNLKGWIELLVSTVAALAVLGGLAGAAVYYFRRAKAAATAAEIQRLNQEKVTKILDRMKDAGIAVPDDITKALSDIKAEATLNLLADNKAKLTDILNKQLAMTETLVPYGTTADLQKSIWSMENDLKYNLGPLDPADLADRMDFFDAHIKANALTIDNRLKTITDKVSQADREAITEGKDFVDNRVAFVDNNETLREELNNNEIPKIEE